MEGQGEGDSLVEYGFIKWESGHDFEVVGDDCGKRWVRKATVGVADIER